MNPVRVGRIGRGWEGERGRGGEGERVGVNN